MNQSQQDFMNQFNQFGGDAQKMFEPWTKLNQAFLKNAEMMTEFSLDTIKTYSEMGLENMRQVAEINSPESAKDFSSKQAEMLKVISQQMLMDAQRMTELGTSMQNEVMQVMSEVGGQTGEQMQSAMQKTAEQATKTAQEYVDTMNKVAEQTTQQAAEATKAATESAASAMKSATSATKSATSATKSATSASNSAKSATTKTDTK